MKIALLGDVHGNWHRLLQRLDQMKKRHGISAALQVGDFGFFPLRIHTLFALAPTMPVPLHVIDGNHENHRWLRECMKNGSMDRWKEAGLHYHRRGTVETVGGCSIGFLGGALHADRKQSGCVDRGTTNWVTPRDVQRALTAFRAHSLDLLLTHSCPHSMGIGMTGTPELSSSVERYITEAGHSAGPADDCGEQWLTALWQAQFRKPPLWIFGHFHAHHHRRVHNVSFHCVGTCDGGCSDDIDRNYIFDTESRRLMVPGENLNISRETTS